MPNHNGTFGPLPCDDGTEAVMPADGPDPAVLRELNKIARALLRREHSGHTLQPTALVNEAWIRSLRKIDWSDKARQDLLCLASHTMRQILTDHARKKKAVKRNAPDGPAATSEQSISREESLTLERSLRELQANDPMAAQIVCRRFVDGLSIEEVARELGISAWRVKEDSAFAVGWLRRRIGT